MRRFSFGVLLLCALAAACGPSEQRALVVPWDRAILKNPKTLEIVWLGSPCSTDQEVSAVEDSESVTITVTESGSEGNSCNAAAAIRRKTVTLRTHLGDRDLRGCGSPPCKATPAGG